MTIRNRFCCAALLVLLLVTGCADQKRPTGPLSPLTVSSLALEVGTEWVYAAEDTLRGFVDTIEVRIDSLIDTSGGRRITLWTHNSRQNLITRPDHYVTQVADTVSFAYDPAGDPVLRLVFPLVPGKEWSYRSTFGGYFAKVEGEVRLSTPPGYYRTLLVHNELQALGPPDVTDDSQIWIAPGVGRVCIEQARGHMTASSFEIWRLLSWTSPLQPVRW